MPKRSIWFVAGTAAGVGSSLWLQRKVRSAVERYSPEKVQARAADTAKSVVPTIRSAVAEGRAAMRQREDEMNQWVAEKVDRHP